VLKNCLTVFLAARKIIKEDQVKLIHARSYIPAAIAYALGKLYSVPYLFDVRGYWIDELADEGRWFNHRATYKIGKFIERKLLQSSEAIVTLTKLHADDLREGLLKKFPEKQIGTIPTCADYEALDTRRLTYGAVPDAIRTQVEDKLTVGLVGSVNSSYCLRESLFLFRCLLERRADAHLLCLTRQISQMETLLREANIPNNSYTLTTARHQDMAEWLSLMKWALLLLNTKFSKRGSVPTKLAEFFASGVRIIQHGCNSEVSEKVREAGSGIVLDRLRETDLRQAALAVADAPILREDVLRARESTRAYFSVEVGVNRYEELLNKLIGESGA
jgi:glycosyltransferase involved in cell wall biosynthesis